MWEITLKCNLLCSHCGSRAGPTRNNELSTAEALDLVHQLAEVGIKEVSLIGGEAFLRPDWLDIAREVVKCGMRCALTTGGYGVTHKLAAKMADAGISAVSVSVDGLEATHDAIRGRKGSWQFCMGAIGAVRDAGIYVGANSQFNRKSAPELPLLYSALRDAGISGWQIQLTVPMGNAADNNGILLQPAELLDLYPVIAYLATRGQREGIEVQPGNNIGYFGPYERLLRGRGDPHAYSFYRGCQAGITSLGLEADGTIKGCPSLPTNAYSGGNIRDRRLADIVANTPELTFNETQGTDAATDHLWGFCAQCEFAEVCRGGCNWTSHVFFDRRGNNPYCHHRALTQAGRGLRERTVQTVAAAGNPFDNGKFDLYTEPLDAAWPDDDPQHFHLGKVQWPDGWLEAEPELLAQLAIQRDQAIDVYRERQST